MKLTRAQQRILDDVRAAGSKTYNGRAAKSIRVLEAAGLVEVTWDMRAQTKGSGIELVHEITVRPK